jgi:hypothetical protein
VNLPRPKKWRDPRRTLILKLRRTVKVSTRHSIEQLGPLSEKQTCKECGHEEIYEYPNGSSEVIVAKLIRYRGHSGGVTGVCKKCSKRAAKERYPLPEDAPKPSV